MKLKEQFSDLYSLTLDRKSRNYTEAELRDRSLFVENVQARIFNATGLPYAILMKTVAVIISASEESTEFEGYQAIDLRDVYPLVGTDMRHQVLMVKYLVREGFIEVTNLRDLLDGACIIHFKLTQHMQEMLEKEINYLTMDLREMRARMKVEAPLKKPFWDSLERLTISDFEASAAADEEPVDDFFLDMEDDIFDSAEDSISGDDKAEAETETEAENVSTGNNPDLVDEFPVYSDDEDEDEVIPSGPSGDMVRFLQDVDSERTLLSFESKLNMMTNNPMQKGWFSDKVQELSKDERIELAKFVCCFLRKGLTLDNRIVLKHRSLLEKGLLINIAIIGEESGKSSSQYMLSPEACRILVKGFGIPNYGFITELADVVNYKDITAKALYYNSDTLKQINVIKHATSQDNYSRITKMMIERKRSPSLSFLLFGDPGTGKTEIVKQVARINKRNMIIADYSKMQSHWCGEAPKRYRQLFIAYKYIAALSDSVPILLFNEADSFMSQRITNITRSYDREENAIQNIMLQEMENFEGIFIATTNCKQNLDGAFDRRFFSKIEVTTPNEANRRNIWKSISPSYITEDIFNILARDYEFTGANIDNVINRLETSYILYGKTPLYEDIIRECESEKGIGEPRMKPQTRVGFRY